MNHNPNPLKRGLLWLYVGVWGVVITLAGAGLTVYLVGTLGDPLARKDAQNAGLEVFDSVLALTEQKVVRYLGEWEFLEPKLPGHFHHIGRWYQSDKANFCIKCHGQAAHSRSPQLRAFLNMHTMFVSCQVCHVREQGTEMPTHFGWADNTSGRMAFAPNMAEHPWGEYGAKIVPLTGAGEGLRPMVLDEEEAFATEFLRRMDKLSEQQKVRGNRFIHRHCIETPVRCSDCHNLEKVFLPYTALGYSSERARFLMSTEVTDLVAKYETFHIPSLLRADEQVEDAAEEKAE